MKTLLRKVPTGLFFQGPDLWTSNPAEARNFKSIDRALDFIATWQLKEIELAFAFDDLSSVTSVPLERMSAKYAEE